MKKKAFDVYVGIGSSAGGFEALSEFVTYLPERTGLYYFLAQHHALGEKSILANLLNRKSTVKVVLVELGMVFKPDIFYVLPPELKILIKKNKPTALKADLNLSIPLPNADLLFSELSTLKDSKIIVILFSGTGKDGTEGMRVVKDAGGITIAQVPEEALFESMPKSAIEANLVDYVLDVKDIAMKLVKLSSAFSDGTYKSEEIPFDAIVKILHKEKQLDLFKYKEETINRRIQKRMDALGLETTVEYAKYVKENQEEVDILNQEVLIGVTEFFRGEEAFEALKEQIKQKLIQKPQHSEFRLWSVACSSGEEAYSLAILVNEICQELNKKFYIKIFASDIDDIALQKAKAGEYKANALEHMQSELVEKYFLKTEYGYKVVKTLREQIIFAHHNFLNNPPFIKIDVVSCRNVLIYLKSDVQGDIFSIFHYSLNEDGLLFLGSSESTLQSPEFFTTLDNKNRIYEKKYDTKQPSFQMHVVHKYSNSLSKTRKQKMHKSPNTQEIEKNLQEDLFEYFSNGSLIVDNDFNIVYKKGDIPYLHFSDGLLSLNLFDNLDKQLHYEARAVIKKVQLSNMREMSKFIQLKSSKNETFVRVIAQPFVIPTYKCMILINFGEISAEELILNGTLLPSFDENSVISTLSSQVSETRSEMQNLSDELAFSKQNMAMMNGELQDSNEKLQSTVEELETSNEELQSSNEELQVSLTSNRELQNKLSLILESSMDGVVGLDMQSRHTFVNAQAAKMLGYSSEYLLGKESHRVWHHTKPDGSFYPEEECPIVSVLREGKSSRGEDLFWRKDGTSFPVEVMRSPIMEDEKIIGAVVSFHDISETKALELKIASEHALMDTYLKVSGLIIVFIGLDGIILDINDAGARVLGISKDKIIGMDWFENFTHSSTSSKETFYSIINDKEKSISHMINKIFDVNKEEHLISWSNATYTDEYGKIVGVLATGSDITKEEYLSEELLKSNLKYEQTFKAAQIGIAHIAPDGSWIDVNEYFCKLVGYTKAELLKLKFQDITYKDDLDLDLKYVKQLLDGETDTYHMEKRYIRKNGNIVWINISVVLMRDSSNKPLYFISIIQDISQIKMLMFELETKKNEFENIIRFAPNPMMVYSEDGTVMMLNEAFSELSGYTLKDIPTIKKWNEKVIGSKNIVEKEMIKTLFKNNVSIDKGQMKVVTKDAKELIWIRSLAPLGNIYNGQKVIVYSATDITKMQEKEEMMLAQSRQAAMGDMIGMIAHQWRQPLSVISMTVNNLRADLELDLEITSENLYELVDVINEQTQSLSHTIDDFRTFMRPVKEKEKVSLCDIYAKLRNMIEITLQNNEVTLSFVNSCEVELSTYTNELIQVFINLLNNSKDAFLERKIKNAKIEIITTFDAKFLTIEVKDNAGGIEKSVIKKLGEPYVSTKSINGTGLGLYMSKMIVEKHFNGNISWKNCDKGSCFTIKLPLV